MCPECEHNVNMAITDHIRQCVLSSICILVDIQHAKVNSSSKVTLDPNTSPVRLVGTFLARMTLAWFAPVLEKKSPILKNFDEFIKEI